VKSSELLRRIAGFGLSGQSGVILDIPLDGRPWRLLLDRVLEQRLIGYLLGAVECGVFGVTDEQRDEVADLHLQACARVLRLEQILLEVSGELERAGIDVVVLKGSALAHLAYPDPALRIFGDNDLLIRSEQYDAAIRLLLAIGYERQTAEARAGFERRFAKGTTLSGPDGDELDVHRNLVFGTFGFVIELDELFRSSAEFRLGDRRLRALGPETRLMHACYHAALGDPKPRYSSVRDIAQMLATGTHDPRRVIELARRWESKAVLARGFMLCRGLLGVEPGGALVEAVTGYEPSRRERRAIASYVGPNRHFAAKVVASLPYVDGLRSKLAFLRAAVAPEPEFAMSHGGDPGLPWVRRGLASLCQRDSP
jgi:hypothetical protein